MPRNCINTKLNMIFIIVALNLLITTIFMGYLLVNSEPRPDITDAASQGTVDIQPPFTNDLLDISKKQALRFDLEKVQGPIQLSPLNKESKTVEVNPTQPMWNCDLYHCGDKNRRIYPPLQVVLNSLDGLYNFNLKSVDNGNTDLIIIYDVNCPNCTLFTKNDIDRFLSAGKNLKFIPSAYSDIENLNDSLLKRTSYLLCSVDKLEAMKKLAGGYQPLNFSDGCSKQATLNQITSVKSKLKPYDLGRGTPVFFTSRSIMVGYNSFDVITKYM